MSDVLNLYAAAVVLAAGLAIITVWSPRKTWVKLTAVVVAGLFMPAAYVSLSLLLSRPKPVSIEWVRAATTEAVVAGASLQEGKAIYLWLQFAGLDEPRAYVMPWSREMAQQLTAAQRIAAKGNGKVRMRAPFQRAANEGRRKFYAEPEPPRPPKSTPLAGPLRYHHPSNSL